MKYSLFCQRYQSIKTPASIVMLKTEKRFMEIIDVDSVADAEANIDFPDISNRGVMADFGNISAKTPSILLPIKNRWYNSDTYQIVIVGRQKPK
jgi:hypothetical protein